MSGYNMAAGMYGMFPNIYNNQVALNDLSGLDFYSPIGNMMMGMNGSIFPGMGYMMPFGGNYQNYYKNYDQYNQFMIDSQVRQRQRMRDADLRLNSPQEGLEKHATVLREKIAQDEQQQILPAFKSYLKSVKELYGEGATYEEIKNRAMKTYHDLYHTSITDDIRKHGKDSYTQGLFQTLTFGLADNRTAEENISELTGEPVSRWEQAKKIAGNATGGALIGVGGAITANCIWKNKGPIAKAIFRVPVLAAIGGIAASIMAFTSSNTNKDSKTH